MAATSPVFPSSDSLDPSTIATFPNRCVDLRQQASSLRERVPDAELHLSSFIVRTWRAIGHHVLASKFSTKALYEPR